MWGWTLWENSQGSSHFNRMWSTDRILTSAKMVTLHSFYQVFQIAAHFKMRDATMGAGGEEAK